MLMYICLYILGQNKSVSLSVTKAVTIITRHPIIYVHDISAADVVATELESLAVP